MKIGRFWLKIGLFPKGPPFEFWPILAQNCPVAIALPSFSICARHPLAGAMLIHLRRRSQDGRQEKYDIKHPARNLRTSADPSEPHIAKHSGDPTGKSGRLTYELCAEDTCSPKSAKMVKSILRTKFPQKAQVSRVGMRRCSQRPKGGLIDARSSRLP